MGTNERHLVASAIASEMQRAERSVRWVADSAGIDRAVLASKLAEREDFTMVDLANIAGALGVPAAALTPSIGPAVP